MQTHARSAVLTNTKQNEGLLLALTVHQTLLLQLAASRTPPVNVTLGSREKMEPNARSATPAPMHLDWGLLVQAVLPLQSLQLAASQKPLVNVTLDTREKMEICAHIAPPALISLD